MTRSGVGCGRPVVTGTTTQDPGRREAGAGRELLWRPERRPSPPPASAWPTVDSSSNAVEPDHSAYLMDHPPITREFHRADGGMMRHSWRCSQTESLAIPGLSTTMETSLWKSGGKPADIRWGKISASGWTDALADSGDDGYKGATAWPSCSGSTQTALTARVPVPQPTQAPGHGVSFPRRCRHAAGTRPGPGQNPRRLRRQGVDGMMGGSWKTCGQRGRTSRATA